MNSYTDFLSTKRATVAPVGFEVAPECINPKLFKFQRDIVRWALHLGRAAIFAGVGLGKTGMQLEWSKWVAEHTGGQVLIFAPLAVAEQTVREGVKFGIPVKHVQEEGEIGDAPISITNYDRIHKFNLNRFVGVVLDESSILKHYSKTFFALVEACKDIPYRLCCTATPAPNDFVELGNHALFLGIMHFKDMMARWFIGEGDVARSARLKHYARADFWRWVTSWAVCISKPADLGTQYDMSGYDLPELHIHEHRLGANKATIERAWRVGKLLPDDSASATGFMKVKRESLDDRVQRVTEILNKIADSEPVIIWCDTDFEADALLAAIPGALEMRGSHSPTHKEKALLDFSEGRARIFITKPEIAGFGLNWQHCRYMVFAGVSFSFERTYQALGRCYRYGQTREVYVHLVYAETEGNVMQLLNDKRAAFDEMQQEMNQAMAEHGLFREESVETVYSETEFDKSEGDNWTFYLGDCVQVMAKLPPDCIDLTVTSIPFSNLYVYSDKRADVGNAQTEEQFFEHMAYVIRELLRITKPGRCCAVHVKDLPLFQNRDGVMGINPFSDSTTAAFRRGGWVLQSRVTIEKDPVIEMEKTNSHGLLMKNFKERAELLRVGLPDYVLIFQKPGDIRENRVRHDPDDETYYGAKPPLPHEWLSLPTRGKGANNYNLPVWQRYANPNWSDVEVPLVWTNIDQTDVLNYLVAKSDKDERHICPLQLDLIGRLIHWKSNPNDVIFDPFAGIASTGYKALEMGRRSLGVELKPEYHALGTKYLKAAETSANQPTLFEWAEMQKQMVEVNNGAGQ